MERSDTLGAMSHGRGIASVIAVLLGSSAALASDLTVVGSPRSLHARTLVVRDEPTNLGAWSVVVDVLHVDSVVTGFPAEGEAEGEVEIPFLVLIPESGPAATTATITVFHGVESVFTERVVIVRTSERTDINRDGRVDSADLTVLLSSWGPCLPGVACPADLDSDGRVDGRDISALVASWHS